TPPSSAAPAPSPTSPAERLRSSSCLPLILCACPASVQLGPHCAFSLLPTVPVAPAPCADAQPPTRFGSVGLPCGRHRNRLRIRLLKLLGLTFLPLTAPGCAPREAAGARYPDLALLPPRVFCCDPIV